MGDSYAVTKTMVHSVRRFLHGGIEVCRQRFDGARLQDLRKVLTVDPERAPEVKIMFDPKDLGSIHVLDPRNSEYFRVHAIQSKCAKDFDPSRNIERWSMIRTGSHRHASIEWEDAKERLLQLIRDDCDALKRGLDNGLKRKPAKGATRIKQQSDSGSR